MNQLTDDDLKGHVFVIGSTGSGKSNFLLYTMNYIAKRGDSAVIFIDPHGEASLDLARMETVKLFDPYYLPFALNPLELGPYESKEERKLLIQTRVGELLITMADFFGVTVDQAPRLIWILRGGLYFLYSITDTPTFLDLYYLLTDILSMESDDVAALFSSVGIDDEIIQRTLSAISKLEAAAFTAVLNRISNFVMPSGSLTSRTFCTRKSTVPFEELLKPGSVSAFRMSKFQLPDDFRKMATNTLIMDIYFAVQRRMKALERAGTGAITPVYMVIDEFQNVAELGILQTILSEARKFGLYLIVAHQNVSQVKEELFKSFVGNTGMLVSFRVGPEDAAEMAKAMGNRDLANTLVALPNWVCVVRRNPVGGGGLSEIFLLRMPKVPGPSKSTEAVFEEARRAPWGGAEEDRHVSYRDAIESEMGMKGRPELSPARWMILTTLAMRGPQWKYKDLMWKLYHEYGWDESVTLSSINYLVDLGLVKASRQGDDVFYEAAHPAVDKYFQSDIKGPRAGGPVHQAIIRRLLRRYWETGYWCKVDDGSFVEDRPDILLFRPLITQSYWKGERKAIREPARWDYSNVTAVEVETMLGHRSQIKHNLEKNRVYSAVTFVTDSDGHAERLKEILGEGSYTVLVENIGEVEEEAPDDLDSFLVGLVKDGWPGMTAAAERAHVNRRTVQRHMDGLIRLGVIAQNEEDKYHMNPIKQEQPRASIAEP
ncbi:MAG: type IV secretion system DNA-binding domain-containing protein [Nitrososphaerota archaeon]|nr:type IV secretion system DNA-binding domain-containing protein [Nitrososphaerota archaeon]